MRFVDADELIPLIKLGETNEYTELGEGRNGGIAFAIERIKQMPTADVVERKTGEWIDDKGLYKCSNCNHVWSELWWTRIVPINEMYQIIRFCPACGAEMRERSDNGEIH